MEQRVVRRVAGKERPDGYMGGAWGPGMQKHGYPFPGTLVDGGGQSEWARGRAVDWHYRAGALVSIALPPRGSRPDLARQFVGRLQPQGYHPSARLRRDLGTAVASAATAPALPQGGAVCPRRRREGAGAAFPRSLLLFCGFCIDGKFLLLGHSPNPSSGPSSWPALAIARDQTLEGGYDSILACAAWPLPRSALPVEAYLLVLLSTYPALLSCG